MRVDQKAGYLFLFFTDNFNMSLLLWAIKKFSSRPTDAVLIQAHMCSLFHFTYPSLKFLIHYFKKKNFSSFFSMNDGEKATYSIFFQFAFNHFILENSFLDESGKGENTCLNKLWNNDHVSSQNFRHCWCLLNRPLGINLVFVASKLIFKIGAVYI